MGAQQTASSAADRGREYVTWPRRRLDVLYALNQAAATYWHKLLLRNGEVLDYLRDRGWADPVALARRYGLGYAPDSEDRAPSFVRMILARGFSGTEGREDLERALLAAGIARRNRKDGRLRDLFYGRLMFPIPRAGEVGQVLREASEIIAFGGRILPRGERRAAELGWPAPKYVNTPETALFHKGAILYGLPWARRAVLAERRLVIFEGYMDLIRVRESGIENVAACLGTALTAEHMRTLRALRLVGSTQRPIEIVLATDGDMAGRKAAERGSRVVLEAGLIARVVTFPDDQDPDEILRSGDPAVIEEFRKLIVHAPTPVINYLDVVCDMHGGAPWTRSLRSFVKVLRDIRDRSTGASFVQLQQDAKAVALRIGKLESDFPLDASNILDLCGYRPGAWPQVEEGA